MLGLCLMIPLTLSSMTGMTGMFSLTDIAEIADTADLNDLNDLHEFADAQAVNAQSTALNAPPFTALVFTRTAGFRHDSIPAGIAAMGRLSERHGFEARCTEDPAEFTAAGLRGVNVIVFLNTTGDVLNDEQQAAMEEHLRGGAGFVGVHAAADTEYDWPWYTELVGAMFRSHPHIQPAMITVEQRMHPATRHLSATWSRTDEWYDFRDNPRARVEVLLRLEPGSYEGSVMEDDHPIAWCHEHNGVRAFYTAGGHTSASFAEPDFLRHLYGALYWAAGRTDEAPTTQPISGPTDRTNDRASDRTNDRTNGRPESRR